MSVQDEVLDPGLTWLLDQWVEKFSGVLSSMTEEHPTLTWSADEGLELGERALIIEQRFAGSPEPMLWLGMPEVLHQGLGSRVLAAAGVEGSDPEENRSTALEIVEQSIGGLVTALNGRLDREIAKTPSTLPPFFPNGLSVVRVVIAFGEVELAPYWIAFNPVLVSWMEEKPADAPTEQVAQASELPPEPEAPTRNFDLLLDVALPVSVSFGRTELAVKDVLKLTTGSIVEMNRAINEPVEIIVNNCVIARGEVVVVEGNYGVRILSLVSRKERLRTGGAAVVESRARVGVA